jgi:hypothetical protein
MIDGSALVSQLNGHKDGKTYPTSPVPIPHFLKMSLAFLTRRERIIISSTFNAINNTVKLDYLTICQLDLRK